MITPMTKKDLKDFLRKFKEVAPKKESEPEQTKFDLDLRLKKNVDDSKIGYKVKELNKYKRFEINQENKKEQEKKKR